MRGRTSLFAACVMAVGCAPAWRNDPLAVERVRGDSTAFLSGRVAALGEAFIADAEDFVWDARLSHDGRTLAFAHLAVGAYKLALTDVETRRRRADLVLNETEFDVEMLEFSNDDRYLAVVSRNGSVKVFEVSTGAMVSASLTDEPLVSLAFGRDGSRLAVGSARGLVTVLSWPSLEWQAEARIHHDEVRGLAFDADDELVSAGWDGSLLRSRVVPGEADSVRVHVERRGIDSSLRASLGQASIRFSLDARVPLVVVRPEVASALRLVLTGKTVTVPTALGVQVVPLAVADSVRVKGAVFGPFEVGVCEVCVPSGVEGVLGAPFFERVDVVFDDVTREARLSARDNSKVRAGRFELLQRFSYPAALNDLSLDASGRIAAVAFSHTRAQRTREVYLREKRHEIEPPDEWNAAAMVQLESGAVMAWARGHRGVVSTAAVTPDGSTLAAGGWDQRVTIEGLSRLVDARYGWAVRRVRFSRDGRWLIVAAWTPENLFGDHQSTPSAAMIEVIHAAK